MSTKRIRRRRKRNETQSRWCIGRDVFDQGRLVHFLSNHLNRCITFLQIVDFYGRGGGGGISFHGRNTRSARTIDKFHGESCALRWNRRRERSSPDEYLLSRLIQPPSMEANCTARFPNVRTIIAGWIGRRSCRKFVGLRSMKVNFRWTAMGELRSELVIVNTLPRRSTSYVMAKYTIVYPNS